MYDIKKITQALNYVATKSGSTSGFNKLKAIKLLYFADRYHLRKYGRSITNDNYYAMEYGPVGEVAKDVAEESAFLDSKDREYSEKFIKRINQNNFKVVGELDEEVFSESDTEALRFALEHFSKFNQFDLAKLSHAYPEWSKFKTLIEKSTDRHPMSIEDFFSNPAKNDPYLSAYTNGLDYFKDFYDEHAQENYLENRKIEISF